jgi:SAM-dependent methyltransferase
MDEQSIPSAYDRAFSHFNAPLMQKFRELAYGKDIGQHSWTTADELDQLSSSVKQSLTYIAEQTGCRGTGLDISEAAIRIAHERAVKMDISNRVEFLHADCDNSLPVPTRSFDVALSIDVVLHLRDRELLLRNVCQVLKPGAVFMFTDAGVMTGAMTDLERERRTLFGYTQFVPEGVNEDCIARVGFTLRSSTNSTQRLISTASNRLKARQSLFDEFIAFEGKEMFHKQNIYLETIIDLAQRRILSRFTYTASVESP